MRPGPLYSACSCHVIDILMNVLPGIDCNDINKTMVVFQLISIYGRLIPMRDLSEFATSRPNISPEKRQLCHQTLQFQPFVMEFMDRCFALIDNSSLEQIQQEQSSSDAQVSDEETSIKTGIISCLHSVLHMADAKISDAIIKKLEQYLKVKRPLPNLLFLIKF